jgi:hypothetical protein
MHVEALERTLSGAAEDGGNVGQALHVGLLGKVQVSAVGL